MTTSQRRGFTLIELMIAVVIVGILAAVAYPSMTLFIQRGRRADAVAVLTAIVQAQERYRSNRAAYASTLEELKISDSTKYYGFTLDAVGEPAFTGGYQVTAKPKSDSAQAGDAKNCATLSVKLDGGKFEYLATDASQRDTSATCWAH